MYRAVDGKMRFSFQRMITNAVPNFALDSKNDVDLSPAQQDALFHWQLQQVDPRLLNEKSFWKASISEESQSRQIYRALQKNAVLHPETGVVDTSKITKHFANQLATISVHTQRKLIGLLFFWEEEVMRWRLLDEEDGEVQVAMDACDGDGRPRGDLEIARQSIEVRRKLAPSLRQQDPGVEDLPSYA